ncbi:hypothetical protein [Streptomyces sp. NPDC058252]|uniref:hypothetical protein n=1 Tax=Streptomyces sp. NPDC058252 TaxID=3346405 RepID=UPI0036E4531D
MTYRAAAVPVTLATTPLGVRLSALAELLALVGALVAMLGAEARWSPCRPATGSPVPRADHHGGRE